MKSKLVKILAVCAIVMWSHAVQAVTCNVAATSGPLNLLYTGGAAVGATGTISGTCTKETGDVSRPWIFIGVNQGEPPAGRLLTRQNGTETLNYQIYQGSATGGQWTEATGLTFQSGSNGGVRFQMANLAVGVAQNFSYIYYFRVLALQTGKPAGIYDDQLVGVTVRLSNSSGIASGQILQSTTFGVSVSIQHNCYFSTMPAAMAMNYTAFSLLAVPGASAFQVSCTYNTPYTLSLGSIPPPAVATVNGTAAGLAYTLTLSGTSGSGSAAAQNYSINGSIAAGQPGTCAAATCTATQSHTVYIGF